MVYVRLRRPVYKQGKYVRGSRSWLSCETAFVLATPVVAGSSHVALAPPPLGHWRSLIEEIGRMRRGHPYATVVNSVNITVYVVQNLQSQEGHGPLDPCEAPPLLSANVLF